MTEAVGNNGNQTRARRGEEQLFRQGEEIFSLLQHFSTLRLFGWIPLGDHVIHVLELDEKRHRIRTRESNPVVPVWNHRIDLVRVDAHRTRYTDHVEIGAGWKTFFVWVWAQAFYAHRQRRWIRLLAERRGRSWE